MSDEGNPDIFSVPEKSFEVRTLTPGAWLELSEGRTVQVVDNPRDGVWVLCQEVDVETGTVSEDVEPILCYDMRRLIREGPA